VWAGRLLVPTDRAEMSGPYYANTYDGFKTPFYPADQSGTHGTGGPGITRSDLLIINKIDLAPYVGASLEVMESDTKRMRIDKPYVFTNLKTDEGLTNIVEFIIKEGML